MKTKTVPNVSFMPNALIDEAALTAFRAGNHLATEGGRVVLAPGQDFDQAQKALKIRQLRVLARELRRG